MREFEYQFLTVDEVIELHEMQIERYGGIAGIRDKNLLESAVMIAQASFGGRYVHSDVYEMAAAYAFHVAENQPFIDGNKRATLASALVFLDWHQIEIEDPNEELYDSMIGIAQKKVDKEELAKIFRALTSKVAK